MGSGTSSFIHSFIHAFRRIVVWLELTLKHSMTNGHWDNKDKNRQWLVGRTSQKHDRDRRTDYLLKNCIECLLV